METWPQSCVKLTHVYTLFLELPTHKDTRALSMLPAHQMRSTHLLPNSRKPVKVLLLCRRPNVTRSPSGRGVDGRSELDEEADVEAKEVVSSSFSSKPAPSSCSIRSLGRQSNNSNQSQTHAVRESSWWQKQQNTKRWVAPSCRLQQSEDNTNNTQLSRSSQTSTCDLFPILPSRHLIP